MSDIVIKAENLGKKYTIGHQAENGHYVSLRDVLMQNVRNFWHKTKDMMQGKPIIQGDEMEEVWALKDVSFEIQRGETVGIIGRNGAGKTTLLKILSRITEPSAGRVTIKGRVASLLEVGTGFHPELTGRENIYLNGTILGMTRAEIKKKFDEIVDFAEVEKFLDTPVKRYSSGMYVRLAFAVAAHLEPEMLLVDEVLAVGDAEFQKKCLGKMGDVAKEGRTVLFVSHNMGAVSQLCQQAIVLKQGHLDYIGPTERSVEHYMQSSINSKGSVDLLEDPVSQPNDNTAAKFVKVQLADRNGSIKDSYFIGESLILSIQAIFYRPLRGARLSFIVKSRHAGNIYHCVTRDASFEPQELNGLVTFTATFPELKLYPGIYIIDHLWLATSENKTLDLDRDVLSFQVMEGGPHVFRSLARHAAVVHEVPEWKVIKS